jgi:hypothetical protein
MRQGIADLPLGCSARDGPGSWRWQMLVWTALPILILSALACGPFHDSMPAAVELLAQLAAVLSLFVLVCAVEAGGRNKDSGG